MEDLTLKEQNKTPSAEGAEDRTSGDSKKTLKTDTSSSKDVSTTAAHNSLWNPLNWFSWGDKAPKSEKPTKDQIATKQASENCAVETEKPTQDGVTSQDGVKSAQDGVKSAQDGVTSAQEPSTSEHFSVQEPSGSTSDSSDSEHETRASESNANVDLNSEAHKSEE